MLLLGNLEQARATHCDLPPPARHRKTMPAGAASHHTSAARIRAKLAARSSKTYLGDGHRTAHDVFQSSSTASQLRGSTPTAS